MSTGLLSALMSTSEQTENPAGHEMQVTLIRREKILPNPENDIYIIGNLDSLEDDIRKNGIRQPLEVIQLQDKPGCYMIISGHRRWKACTHLAAFGKGDFEKLPCLIRESHGAVDDRIALITANATARDLTDGERLAQYEALKDALTQKKKAGQLEGKVRDELCRILGLSTGAAARLNVIASCENEIIKERLKNGDIGLMEAYRDAQSYARFTGKSKEEPEPVEHKKTEPAETLPKRAKIQTLHSQLDNIPDWAYAQVAEICSMDWMQELPEFTGTSIRNIPKIKKSNGAEKRLVCGGYADFTPGTVIVADAEKENDFELSWGTFVEECKDIGIAPRLSTYNSAEPKAAKQENVESIENLLNSSKKPRGYETLRKLAEKNLQDDAAWALAWKDVRFCLAYYSQPLPGGAVLWKRVDETRENAGQPCDDYAIILQDNKFYTCGWISYHAGLVDILTKYFDLK